MHRGTGIALAAIGCALGGCSGDTTKADDQAGARAAAVRAAEDAKLAEQLDHIVRCLSAIKWQAGAISSRRIGDAALYAGFFRKDLEKLLGGRQVLGGHGEPVLSRARIDAYLPWAYARDVADFTRGEDADGDGEVSREEQRAAGYRIVVSCVQEAAQHGIGPLAGKDKVAQWQAMLGLREHLRRFGS